MERVIDMYYKRISDLQPLGTPNNGNWNDISAIRVEDGNSIDGINASTATLLKSMWIEVAVSKDNVGKPTGDDSKIVKFEDKRLNLYNFLKLANALYNSSSEDKIIFAENLKANEISVPSGYVKINKTIPINQLKSKTAKVDQIVINNSPVGIDSLYAEIISDKSILTKAKVTNIRGDGQFSFNNIDFRNIDVDEVSALNNSEINADSVRLDEVSANLVVGDVEVNTLIGETLNTKSVEIGNDGIIEFFRPNPDHSYDVGTLIKFGTTDVSAEPWEITIADSIANGIVADEESSGIILDNDNHDRVPIVLLGRTKVKVSGPVNKFDRLYADPTNHGIATTPGVVGLPIGVALEDKASPGTGLIDCFAKFNLQ